MDGHDCPPPPGLTPGTDLKRGSLIKRRDRDSDRDRGRRAFAGGGGSKQLERPTSVQRPLSTAGQGLVGKLKRLRGKWFYPSFERVQAEVLGKESKGPVENPPP